MNLVIPLTKLKYFSEDEYNLPIALLEVNGYPLINYVIENLLSIKNVTNYLFILNENDCLEYKLDKIIKVILPQAKIKKLKEATIGSPCSIVMASEYIDKDSPILIVNSDQFFDLDLNEQLSFFKKHKSDVGLIVFEAIHPRWSYILNREDTNEVIEVSEKKPISKKAIAGFYYFEEYELFFQSTMKSIQNESFLNNQLYTSAVVNHAILKNRKVVSSLIGNNTYYSFYSKSRLETFKKKYLDAKN